MTTTPNPCTCRFQPAAGNTWYAAEGTIKHCPLHAAAEQMRDALALIRERASRHEIDCGDQLYEIEAAARTALDAAEGR